jgi:prevent-host-death family protein
MRSVTVREAHDALSACIEGAQQEPLVITRHGHPVALLVGIESRDAEAAALGADPLVWSFVQRRRAGKFVSHAAAARRLRLK